MALAGEASCALRAARVSVCMCMHACRGEVAECCACTAGISCTSAPVPLLPSCCIPPLVKCEEPPADNRTGEAGVRAPARGCVPTDSCPSQPGRVAGRTCATAAAAAAAACGALIPACDIARGLWAVGLKRCAEPEHITASLQQQDERWKCGGPAGRQSVAMACGL